ncbi:MAG: class GN sortase [Thiohalomonadales bacterium]
MKSSQLRRALVIIIAASGIWQIGQASYIYAKAGIAQYLIQSSWQATLRTQIAKKPWPWADTWPVSRLIMPKHDVDLFILAGDNGRTLAFGPGYRFGSSSPGDAGNSLIAAHRDTHFNFLKNVVIGEHFSLQNSNAVTQEYEIVDIRIRHYKNVSLPRSLQKPMLTLVTCYPFNAMTTGGPMRYIVIAEQILNTVLL